MNHYLGIIVLMVMAGGLWGQSSQNPFDLKYREARPGKSPIEQSVTPADTVKPLVSPETIESTSPAKPSDGLTADTSDFSIISELKDSSGSPGNPFETNVNPDEPEKGEEPLAIKEKEESDAVPTTVKKEYGSRGFQMFFLLLSILFLIFIVNVERSFIRDLWRVISNENYSSLHHRNQRNTMRQILLLMGYFIFFLQAGLFIHLSLQVHQVTEGIMTSLWLSIAVVLGVYLVRHSVIRYLKWLFNNEKELSLFAFDISIFNTMVGLILLPINILLIFGPETMYNALIITGLVVAGVAYLLRQIRWMMSSGRLIFNSLFLFFIYLCAVEILPLWTISKIIW